MTTRQFNLDLTKIKSIVTDETRQRLWIAYEQDSDGTCLLQNVSAFDPTQVYYSIAIEATNIVKLIITTTYVYALLDDATYILGRFSLTNPLSTQSYVARPVGYTDAPGGMIFSTDTLDYFILFPGLLDANASVIKYLTSNNSLITTITLDDSGNIINNAVDISYDTDIYVVTSDDPTKLVRIYLDGIYLYQVDLIE